MPPPPLTPLQRRLVWIAAVLVAASRVWALSQTLWDWDEAQFAMGIRELDVAGHRPHPLGFPVFMGLAKFVRLFTATEFGALQTVTFIGACALFPLAFLLARELRFPFATAACGALLFTFLPNVWFYGGTGFSDISGVAFTIAAAAMLLRGCRDGRAYLLGALLLGLASGMRPQAVMLGAAPFAVASWFQLRSSWRRVVAACAIAAGTVAAAYTVVALSSSSVAGYIQGVRGVGEWVRTVDAYTAPGRPPLSSLPDEYFVRPMGAGRLGIVVSILAALGAIRGLMRREGPRVGLAILTFLPFAVFAYLSLDYNSIHRYSTAYLFLWTLLAAHAFAPVWRWPVAAQVTMVLLMSGRYAHWGGVMLTEVRNSDSPTHAASTLARKLVPPGGRIWIDGSMQPFADYYLHDRELRFPRDRDELLREARSTEYLLIEGAAAGEETHRFVRPTGRVWDVARRRYFSASLVPVGNFWSFGEGWHWEEQHEEEAFRWMAARSVTLIPPGTGRARLRLTLAAQDIVAPTVEVLLNGRLVDRFVLTPEKTTKEWIVSSRSDTSNVLVIQSSAVMNPKKLGISEDVRDLSLRLFSYGWRPVR